MAIDRNKVQQQAEKLVASGKIEAGIAQYQTLVADNPRDLGTLNKVGDLYVRLNKKAEAIKNFTRIAEIYADDGFFLKAIAIYKKINKIDPSHVETIQRLADLYAKQGLKTEARAQYLVVADALMKAGQAPKAIGVYESLVAMEPENLKNRLALAELKLKYGKRDDAAHAFLELAQELDAKGLAKESAKVYEMALSAGRGDVKVAEGLGAALVASGQHEKALAIAEQTLKEHPGSAAMLAVRADGLAGMGKVEEAAEALRRILAQDPRRADASLSLARLLVSRKKGEEAREVLTPAHEAIVAGGRGADLAKVLETILALDPASREVLQDLFKVHGALGNKAGAAAFGEKLAEACAGAGDFDNAVAVAKRLTEMEPGSAAHRERLARMKSMAEGEEVSGPRRSVTPTGPSKKIDGSGKRAAVKAEPPAPAEPEEYEIQVDAGRRSEEVELPAEEEDVADATTTPAGETTLTPEDEEFISEHLTEAEVFVKYGLADRAAEQLTAIVERFPGHIPSRQRLRDVYLEEGNRARAANEAAALARILAERGDRTGSTAALQEAKSIDASCPAIQQVEALLKGEIAATPGRTLPVRPPPAPESEEGEFVIEEEEEEEEVGETLSAPAARVRKAPPQEDLGEFDFFLSQKMIPEAAACLSRLEASFGPHPEIERRRLELGRATAEAPEPEEEAIEIEPAAVEEKAASDQEPPAELPGEAAEEPAAVEAVAPEPEEGEAVEVQPEVFTAPGEVKAAPPAASAAGSAADFFDLASELDASLFSTQEAGGEESVLAGIEASPEGHSLDEIVSAFKKGIEQQVDSEDFETHYNLGIAYKEMGLIEEAIAEFQFASKDARLLPDCCSMLGICFKEKGMLPLAVKWYQKGLEALSGAGGSKDDERLSGVRFDLAEVLEQMGEYRQAMNLFVEVYGTDSRYRDVSARIKDLEKRLSS